MDDSDAEVIARSLVEPSAFGMLFDRHAAVLLRFFVRRVGPDAADSLVGDAFLIAFERRAHFDRACVSARPWLYGIATRLLSRHHRTEARRINATAQLAAQRLLPDDFEQRAADVLDAQAERVRVARAVGSLPAGERDALLLLAWEDLTYAEIAAALCVPIGTVRSRISRARLRMRAVLEEVR